MIVAELIDRCDIPAEKPVVRVMAQAAPTLVASEDEGKGKKRGGLFGRKKAAEPVAKGEVATESVDAGEVTE